MNYNYIGSIAQRKMHFSSSVETVADEVKNLLFDAVTIYIPSSKAAANIVDYASLGTSPTIAKPLVFTCTVDNYKDIMKGDLLSQWQPAFRDDTNIDLTLYLIVFLEDSTTANKWEITKQNIAFEPLTNAFNAMFNLSYFKVMFDETYDGKPTTSVSQVTGTKAKVVGKITNSTSSTITIPSGTYALNDGTKTFNYVLSANKDIAAGGEETVAEISATEIGIDLSLVIGTDLDMNNVLPAGLDCVVTSFTQGTNTVPAHNKPSTYFDLSLALACLCKGDIKLSYCLSFVKLSFANDAPATDDPCFIRIKTKAEELAKVTDLRLLADYERAQYFWGCLYKCDCVYNTWVIAHSEDQYLFPVILNSYFAEKNASGEYIGNKLSLLRLTGTQIKPFGYPSWLNSAVNVNDPKGFEIFDEKNVGYLSTISDNTVQDCAVSSARSIDGTPLNAQMMSKFIDYNSAMDCAELITDKGTLANPVLTNEDAYSKIQNIVSSYLQAFGNTGRLTNLQLTFPSFTVAKTSKTALTAASSWSATYTDDLDEVTVTGGITA